MTEPSFADTNAGEPKHKGYWTADVILIVAREIMKRRKHEIANSPYALSDLGYRILEAIYACEERAEKGSPQPGVSFDELETMTEANKPALSREVTALLERGLISKRASAEDRRVKFVFITPAGVGELRRIDDRMANLWSEATGDLSDTGHAQYEALLANTAKKLGLHHQVACLRIEAAEIGMGTPSMQPEAFPDDETSKTENQDNTEPN